MDAHINMDENDLLTFSSLNNDIISNALSDNSPNSENNVSNVAKSKFKWEEFNYEKFFIKNCASDGNSQFCSIENGLKGSNQSQSHKKLRNLIGEYIVSKLNDKSFKELLDNYKILRNNGDFIGNWNPFKIKTKKQFIKEIKKIGFNFQGDNITLSLLSKALKIDFIIFSENDNINEQSNIHENIICLYFSLPLNHYKILGIKDEKLIHTIFNRSKLPNILEKLIRQDYFYKMQIEKYYSKCIKSNENFTITGLYNYLNVPKNDKKIITQILRDFLVTIKIKERPPKLTLPEKPNLKIPTNSLINHKPRQIIKRAKRPV
jgi:hypothetical protein